MVVETDKTCVLVFLLKMFLSVPGVVTKYSNFISFPLFLNGRRLNTLQVRLRAMDRVVTRGGNL